jgi:hypothetical protein
MSENSRYIHEIATIHAALAGWIRSAARDEDYLLGEILAGALGMDAESKEAQRIAPHAGRILPDLGMVNKRKRGPRSKASAKEKDLL